MINPAIALGVRPPQVEIADPAQNYARGLTLKNLLQQSRMQEMQLGEAERAMQGRRTLADLLRANPDKPEAVYTGLLEAGLPDQAMEFQSQQTTRQKEQLDYDAKKLDTDLKTLKLSGQIYGAMKDEDSKVQGVSELLRRGLLKPQEAMQWLQTPWGPELEAHVKQATLMSMDAHQQLEEVRKAAEAQRAQEEHDATLPGKRAESRRQGIISGQVAQYGMPLADQTRITGEAVNRAEQRRHNRAIETGATEGRQLTRRGQDETRRHNQVVENRLTQGAANAGLVQAVLDNPLMYDDLTPSVKTAIAADLAKHGFSGFGKRLSESAITKMSDSKSAVASLRDLRQVLLDNEQYIGPVSGLQAMNPWSEAREAQADIDRVKQRVGKALEGGVLRKEDEEKYKKILATLQDTPKTAIYKVDGIIQEIERDLDIYVEEQRKAGRKVNSDQTPVIRWERGPDGRPRRAT